MPNPNTHTDYKFVKVHSEDETYIEYCLVRFFTGHYEDAINYQGDPYQKYIRDERVDPSSEHIRGKAPNWHARKRFDVNGNPIVKFTADDFGQILFADDHRHELQAFVNAQIAQLMPEHVVIPAQAQAV